jgi:GTP-binding protein EngB required for normal cell division
LRLGQTGLGKSTLINTIFASHLIDSKGRLAPDEPVRSTTEIQTVSHVIEENGVRLRLNIVDTPGYGDQVNNDRCWDPIVKYIKDQHSAYLRKELTAQRERYIQDTRIHCCLFFIQPSGHALKPIDIVVLKKLSDVVNVVPVIAKSDSLTLEERSAFKERIKEEFAFHNLKMFPYDNDEFDEEERALNAQIKVSLAQSWSLLTSTDIVRRTSSLSLLSVQRSQLSWEESKSVDDKTDGGSSMLRTRITANLSTSATSSHAPISKTSSRPLPKSITRPSVPSSCLHLRRAVQLVDTLVADLSRQQLTGN